MKQLLRSAKTLSCLALAGALLAGRGAPSGSGPSGTSGEKRQLVFWESSYYTDLETNAFYRVAIEKFNEMHPDVEFVLGSKGRPAQEIDALTIAFSSDAAPDMFGYSVGALVQPFIDGGKLEGILPSEDGKTFAFTYELISLPAEGAVENVKITATTTEPEKGKVTLSTNLGEIAPAEIATAGETSVTITVTPEAGKAYSVTYEGTKYEADENGVITIPVTVSEEQITNGAAIAFTVVTEDTGDGVNLTAPEGYTILSGGKITAAGEQTARVKIDAFAVDTAYAVTVNGETVVPTLYLGSKELVVTYTLDELTPEQRERTEHYVQNNDEGVKMWMEWRPWHDAAIKQLGIQ